MNILAKILGKRAPTPGPIPPLKLEPDAAMTVLATMAQGHARLADHVLQLTAIHMALFHALGKQPGLYDERFRRDFLQAVDELVPVHLQGKTDLIDGVAGRFDAAMKSKASER